MKFDKKCSWVGTCEREREGEKERERERKRERERERTEIFNNFFAEFFY